MSDAPDTVVAEPSFEQIWNEEVLGKTGAVEAPPATDTPAQSAATPDPEPGATPRNEKGQFAKAQEPAPAAATPAPADAPAAVTPEGSEPKPPDEPAYPEYTVKAEGRDYGFEGSKVGPDGIFIPVTHQEHLTRLLTAGLRERQQARDFGRQLSQAKRDGQLESQKAQALIAKVYDLLGDDAELVKFRLDHLGNREKLILQAELDAIKAERAKELDERQTVEQEQYTAALVPRLHDTLKGYIQKLGSRPEFTGVDREALYKRLSSPRFLPNVFRELEEGEQPGPDDVSVEGRIVGDAGFLFDEMSYEASIVRRAKDEAAKQATVRDVNTRAVSTPPAKAGTPTPKAKPKEPGFSSAREADDYFFGKGFNL